MRKLLVASQKSGVGKTTAAVNIANVTAQNGARVLLVDVDPVGTVSMALNLTTHIQRQPLRKWGFDLEGEVCQNVVTGLDVISPYDSGVGSEEDLQKLLQFLGSNTIKQRYDCIILNAPPFIGERPESMLKCCDEILLVLRAESVAFRTLPLFLEMVKTMGQEDGVGLRGILLTLPEEERWEKDLRRYLGNKALPQLIPNDPEVARCESEGVAVTTVCADSPAAQQYMALANELDLAHEVPLPEPVRISHLSAGGVKLNGSAASGNAAGANAAVMMPPGDPVVKVKKGSLGRPAARRRAGGSSAWWANQNRGRSGSGNRRVSEQVPASPMRRTPVQPEQPPPQPVQPPTQQAAAPAPQPTPSIKSKPIIRTWQCWLGGAVLVGAGMGVASFPAQLLPIGAGLATGAGAVIVLKRTLRYQAKKAAANKAKAV